MPSNRTTEAVLADALVILQRGLPPGDLDDKGVVVELWGLFDKEETRRLMGFEGRKGTAAKPSPPSRRANQVPGRSRESSA